MFFTQHNFFLPHIKYQITLDLQKNQAVNNSKDYLNEISSKIKQKLKQNIRSPYINRISEFLKSAL